MREHELCGVHKIISLMLQYPLLLFTTSLRNSYQLAATLERSVITFLTSRSAILEVEIKSKLSERSSFPHCVRACLKGHFAFPHKIISLMLQ